MKKVKVNFLIVGVLVSFCLACQEDVEIEPVSSPLKTTANKVAPHELWSSEIKLADWEQIIQEEERFDERNTEVSIFRKVTKQGKPLFVHYMPWFRSLEHDGAWGQHWTMTNRNPDIVDASGKRQIASHYYPLIGPYATRDKDLQQYHLLLMQLSGVEGVIFDWYGMRDILNFDQIKQGVESFILELEKTPLQFCVMYEDRVIKEQERRLTALPVQQARNDLAYIENQYFAHPNYYKCIDKNLFMVFGPAYIDDKADWDLILSAINSPVDFLSLWGSRATIGAENASGEFAWIDKDHLLTLNGYYNYVIDFSTNVVGGVAYPRFNDYYVEGGWKAPSPDEWTIADGGITAFDASLQASIAQPVDFLQIATWNDFGEGTQIEPTLEHGMLYLTYLQNYTNVPYNEEDLMVAYYIYTLKKQFPNNRSVRRMMNFAYQRAIKGNLSRAKYLIVATIERNGGTFL